MQTFTDDVFASSHVGQTDLQNMENNFQALKSSFSGTSAPSNAVSGMTWYDTTKKILKFRDYANSAWRGVLHGTTAFKIWVYLNAAQEGWVVDSSITDCVLALKGGSQAYNVAGGNLAGSWTIGGITTTVDNHTLTTTEIPSHTHTISYLQGIGSGAGANVALSSLDYGFVDSISSGAWWDWDASAYTMSGAGSGGGHNHTASNSHTGTWRPVAAVGTLQYPNV